MRCTRCGGLAIPQAVGRSRDGAVVFGWCLACLAEEDCTLVEETDISFGKLPRKARRRRPQARPRREAVSRPESARRKVVYYVVGGMVAWTLTLMVLGLLSLSAPVVGAAGIGNRGVGQLLIVGGLLMGVTGLAVWAATLDRRYARRLGPRAVGTSSAILAALTLAWGIVRHNPSRDPWIVATVAVALGVSWWARRAGRSASARKEADPQAIERI